MIMYEWMERLIRLFRLCFACLFFFIIISGTGSVRAADNTNGDIVRQATIIVTYTRYEWWLLRWSDNKLLCQVYIDHEGWPTADDVLTDCGGTIYGQWI